MKIDLEKVIAYSEDSLQNRAIMRNIMLDLYPDCTREMNILLAVYESGIPREIKKNQKIDDNEYSMYVSSIINDYGIDEQLIIEALDAWIDVCIAKGASTHINKPIISHNNKDRISDVYNHPIEHVPINTNTVMIGDDADYEIRTVYGENVEILQYLGLEDEYLVIPSKIGGKNVIGIAKDAFKGFKTLRKINISEGVQYIENGAFAECSLLEEVMLPSTINRIGTEPVMEVTKDNEAEKGAFFKTSIKNIKLPNGLKSLGDFSFYNCIMLESILLPADLVKIGSFAFCNCTSLKSIDLPNGILRINNSTFKNCSSLKKVLLSDNLKTIGNNAFSSTGLCEVQLPSSVKEIEREAFYGCDKLTRIILNEGLDMIYSNAFYKCTSIKKVRIPSTVSFIGKGAFDISNQFGDKSINSELTMYCYRGSGGVTYARKYGYTLKNAEIEKF